MTDPRRGAHEHSLNAIFPVFGEVDTTAAVIAALGRDEANAS